MFLFDTFEPGTTIGSRTLTLDRELLEGWLTLFPDDRDGERMPPGMMAAVHSRAYCSILQPRPPGNVHGQQSFTLNTLPKVGDTLVTYLRCESKKLKGDRRWVQFASHTRRSDGELMFFGLMTTLWAK